MARPSSAFMRASLQLSYRWATPSAKQYAPLLRRLYSTDPPTSARARGGSKVFKSADEAIADIKDGSVVLSAGFGLCGVAGTLIPRRDLSAPERGLNERGTED